MSSIGGGPGWVTRPRLILASDSRRYTRYISYNRFWVALGVNGFDAQEGGASSVRRVIWCR